MNIKQLSKIVSDVGLSDNEARVYISGLSLGPTTILKLSRDANMKRTTIYSVVESLKQKGLMTIEQRGFKQYYSAESPEKLESILEARKNGLREGLSGLMSLYNMHGHESLIKYYEGLEAVKSAYEGMLKDVKAHEEYLVFSDVSKWLELDKKYFVNFSKRRTKLNINIKILLEDNKEAREYLRKDRELNAQIKILPKDVKLSTNLVVIPRRALVHQLVPPIMAMSVDNPSLIQMYREMFNVMWKSIK